MAARVIAFPGAVVDQPRRGCRAERVRARYIDELDEQARAGDIGACAEYHLALLRDFLAEDRRHLLPRCHMAIAAVRKLRRQLAGLGKEDL
jgi:hypothetical protein